MDTSRRSFTLAAACIVFARSVLSARAAPQGPRAPAPARAADPTARTRQLAEAVMAASGQDARLSTLNESMAAPWMAALQKSLPDAGPDWRPAMEQAVQEALTRWNAAVAQLNAEIYATRFTDAQLLDMLMFYRSEGGRALVAQTPAIIREKTEAGRKLAADTVPQLVAAVRARVGCPDRATDATQL